MGVNAAEVIVDTVLLNVVVLVHSNLHLRQPLHDLHRLYALGDDAEEEFAANANQPSSAVFTELPAMKRHHFVRVLFAVLAGHVAPGFNVLRCNVPAFAARL